MPDLASVTIVTPVFDGLLLTTCLLMAAPAKEEDPAARAQATLQRVSKLPLDHQRVWLKLVEQRYDWSVLITLKPEDAQRERDRVAKILRQKTVGWDDLVNFLRDLDQREKAAIAHLVRQYRAEVYDTFHKQPRDMVDRQDAWYRIWSLWEKSGSPPEQQDRLMDWLADAIKVSKKDFHRPSAARAEIWRRYPARTGTTRQTTDAAAGCQAGRNRAGRARTAGGGYPAGALAAGPLAAAPAGTRSPPGDQSGEAGVRGSRGPAK